MQITTNTEAEYHTITTEAGHVLDVSYEQKHRGSVMVDGVEVPLSPGQLAALAAHYGALLALADLRPAALAVE